MLRLTLLALAAVALLQSCATTLGDGVRQDRPLIVKRGCWDDGRHCLVTAVYVPAENVSTLCRKDGAARCVERGPRVDFFGRAVRTATWVAALSPNRPASSYLGAAHEDCHALALVQDLEPLAPDHPAVAVLRLRLEDGALGPVAYLCHREDAGTLRTDDDWPVEGAR